MKAFGICNVTTDVGSKRDFAPPEGVGHRKRYER